MGWMAGALLIDNATVRDETQVPLGTILCFPARDVRNHPSATAAGPSVSSN